MMSAGESSRWKSRCLSAASKADSTITSAGRRIQKSKLHTYGVLQMERAINHGSSSARSSLCVRLLSLCVVKINASVIIRIIGHRGAGSLALATRMRIGVATEAPIHMRALPYTFRQDSYDPGTQRVTKRTDKRARVAVYARTRNLRPCTSSFPTTSQ